MLAHNGHHLLREHNSFQGGTQRRAGQDCIEPSPEPAVSGQYMRFCKSASTETRSQGARHGGQLSHKGGAQGGQGAAGQHYPAFSAEASANAWPTLSQPGPVPNSGPGSRGPMSWPAGLHAGLAEQPWTCLPYSQLGRLRLAPEVPACPSCSLPTASWAKCSTPLLCVLMAPQLLLIKCGMGCLGSGCLAGRSLDLFHC